MTTVQIDLSITASELCLRAAELIKERGMCTTTLKDHEDKVCLLGAFSEILTGEADWRGHFPTYELMNLVPSVMQVADSLSPQWLANYHAEGWEQLPWSERIYKWSDFIVDFYGTEAVIEELLKLAHTLEAT